MPKRILPFTPNVFPIFPKCDVCDTASPPEDSLDIAAPVGPGFCVVEQVPEEQRFPTSENWKLFPGALISSRRTRQADQRI